MSNPRAPKVVGILGLGAMGAGVAGDLAGLGLRVVSCAAGRSAASVERARRAGIECLPTLEALVQACDTFLSIVPADQAEPLAESVCARLQGRPLHYVDCNSITPARTARIAARVAAAGASYSDGGIIGPPPGGRVSTRLYVSGPQAQVLESLQTPRMNVIRLGDSLTQATEMKVLFSAANKGTIALLVNILAAAREVGLLDRVTGELDAMLPGLLSGVRASAANLANTAERWSIEMPDLAEGLEAMGVQGDYHRASHDGYAHLAANLASNPPSQSASGPGLAAGAGSGLDAVLKAWRH